MSQSIVAALAKGWKRKIKSYVCPLRKFHFWRLGHIGVLFLALFLVKTKVIY